MMHGHTSRKIANAFFAFATIALVGACADSTIAPTSQEATVKAPASFDRVVGVKQFRVYASSASAERLGDQLIYIPANSICDLTSTYGASEWNQPCKLMTGSVLITATMYADNEGNPYVDFQPAMRFSPNREVTLYLKSATWQPLTSFNINYCNNSGVCYDESRLDASLKTFRVTGTSIMGRRVKHFSGYSLAAGKACLGELAEGLGGDLTCALDAVVSRRSGYMLASGLADGKEKQDKDKEKDQDER